jgi:HEAT repeat protein
LQSWLTPQKLAEATLSYCVPRNVIDATIRRVVRAAVAFGIALPKELATLAIEHRASSDAPSLVRYQLLAFKQRIESGENDLGSSATRKNWQKLLAQAETHNVEVDDATRALAASDTTLSTRPDAPRSSRPLEGLAAAELKAKLAVPADRLEAIRELCVRGHTSAIEPVFGVIAEVEGEQQASAVAALLGFGEGACDGLLRLLHGANENLRQLAALALGRMRLRRALLPLLQQLDSEESAIHSEIARAIGDFGPGALRMVQRAVAGASHAERLALALAHLANHGSAKEVEKLENDPDLAVASVARKAMAKRSRVEWQDLAVRGQRTLNDAEPAALLSQAFYAEVSKVAI